MQTSLDLHLTENEHTRALVKGRDRINRVASSGGRRDDDVVKTSTTRERRRVLGGFVPLLLTAMLAGCGLSVPADPDGTLHTVTGGELRVGVSPDPGLVSGDDPPTGSIPDLVTGFADTLDAEVEWTVGSEETLVGMLERGQLDLVAGGITDQTPWLDRAGVSRGYTGIQGADGRSLVMLVPLGENAFLSEVERYLDEEVGS